MSFQAVFNGGGDNCHSVSAAHDDEAGRRAGLSFNPAGDPSIGCVKAFAATAMQAVVVDARTAERFRYGQIEDPSTAQMIRHQDAMRNFATALTQLESGKMFAVNGIAATLADRVEPEPAGG